MVSQWLLIVLRGVGEANSLENTHGMGLIVRPKKGRFSIGNLDKIRILGLVAIFIVSFMKRVAHKLCRIILHFGLVTFRSHFKNS